MSYLVRVGRIDRNESGVGARGYSVHCEGNVVVVRWGPIDVRKACFYWRHPPREKRLRFGSPQLARREAERLRQIKCRTGVRMGHGGYKRLPKGKIIRAFRLQT